MRRDDRGRTHGAVLGVLACSLIVLGTAAAAGYDVMKRSPEREAWVRRSQSNLATLDALLTAVADVEDSSRSFALTGDESFVQPFRVSRELIPVLLERMRVATPEREWNGIVALDRLIDERVRVAEVAIATRRRSGPEATRPLLDSGHGEHLSELIRDRLAKMRETEAAELTRDEGTPRQSGDASILHVSRRPVRVVEPAMLSVSTRQNWSSSSAWLRP